ncbi:MAG TPA: gamma-glutamylcyclotransferase [Chitinophagales bacterium]|jgi:gamma-glutamylcyclotransferase (GGCT)/AIG2-like uncharacterized protein YtfP|nr:gamma-glutamylcyclotransferase [Chitinophagales bacterium]HQD12611.1 gamma-glutamylcyclotransferase [Chitinophagales bacterium]HQO30600.1 gamma-glutamylcyclotransferase [Chitinophagales bacterium]HQO88575.1 gamma-glutamylcyclotransferase [Chitinophagales bacterium]
MSEYLFTYGTLRLGQSHPMADYLAKNAELVGLAMLPKSKLYRIDWYPALIQTQDESDEVIGDLFRLKNDEALVKIDEYEGIGEPPYEYRRELVHVKTEVNDLESWVYFYNIPLPENAELITSGDFLNP